MKNILILILFFSCKILTGFAQNATFGSANDAEKEVRQLEMRRFELTVQKNTKELAEILADDLTYTHSNGLLDGKEQLLESLNSGKTLYQSIQSEEIKVRILGETAIINGIAAMRVWSNGQTNNLHLRYTDVYAKRNGKWQLITWQSTRLPQP